MNKTMKCWICKNSANSREHRIKKSDLVSLYGKGPYNEPLLLIKGNANKIQIQGPDQIHLKYPINICDKCNNEFSQPFDKAYEKFTDYVLNNEEKILSRRFIDFEDIYGLTFEVGQRDLFKYFVKSLGCRIVELGHKVPSDLRYLLYKKKFITRLYINFAINEDKAIFIRGKDRFVGLGKLLTSEKNLKTKNDPKYQWNLYISFVHVFFWYVYPPDGIYGSPWTADSKFVYFGSYWPLPNETRNELLDKNKNENK
jgi:hypothetical protein